MMRRTNWYNKTKETLLARCCLFWLEIINQRTLNKVNKYKNKNNKISHNGDLINKLFCVFMTTIIKKADKWNHKNTQHRKTHNLTLNLTF